MKDGRLNFLGTRTKGNTIAQMISFLESQGVKFVYAPYYIKYRLIFESREEIIASSSLFTPSAIRYPQYEKAVKEANRFAFVLYRVSPYNRWIENELRRLGVPYKKAFINEMSVYYPIERKHIPAGMYQGQRGF